MAEASRLAFSDIVFYVHGDAWVSSWNCDCPVRKDVVCPAFHREVVKMTCWAALRNLCLPRRKSES